MLGTTPKSDLGCMHKVCVLFLTYFYSYFYFCATDQDVGVSDSLLQLSMDNTEVQFCQTLAVMAVSGSVGAVHVSLQSHSKPLYNSTKFLNAWHFHCFNIFKLKLPLCSWTHYANL